MPICEILASLNADMPRQGMTWGDVQPISRLALVDPARNFAIVVTRRMAK